MKNISIALSIIILTTCIPFLIAANDTFNFAVSAIPEDLKGNANAVMRYYEREIEVVSTSTYVQKERYAITIINEKGKGFDKLQELYGELIKIKKLSGILYDSEGKVIGKMKLKDATDVSSYISGSVFHGDIRYKIYDFNCLQYPYTVAFEIETENTTFLIPDWTAQPVSEVAIEKNTFTIKFPKALNVRHKEYMVPDGMLKESEAENFVIWQWQIGGLKAYNRQPNSESGNYSTPAVAIAPGLFQLMQFSGDMSTWESFSSFIYELNAERDHLPEEHKAIIHNLTKDFKSNHEKINAIYKYMQHNFRYVAIEYGISGWQTFDAASVVKTGYGDCKGLTNYMKAALKVIGISSHAALVHAGKDFYAMDESFPSNRFNHVILCIPEAEDTIWVECTSEFLTLGYLSAFTQDRNVLLIKKGGGGICKTPRYDKENNSIHRFMQFTYDPGMEDQTINISCKYIGMASDNLIHFVGSNGSSEIQTKMSEKFGFKVNEVINYNHLIVVNHFIPIFNESISMKVKGLINKTPKRSYFNAAWFVNPMEEIRQDEIRTAPIVIQESILLADTIQIDLSPGVKAESLPDSFKEELPFANLTVDVSGTHEKIIIIRRFEQTKGVYDASEYDEYQRIYNVMEKMNNKMKVVLTGI